MRSDGGGYADAVHPRDRAVEAVSVAGRNAPSIVGVAALRPAGSVPPALLMAQQHHGSGEGQHRRLLEHREDMTAFVASRVANGDACIDVRILGSGPTLVMLPGLGRSSNDLDPFA